MHKHLKCCSPVVSDLLDTAHTGWGRWCDWKCDCHCTQETKKLPWWICLFLLPTTLHHTLILSKCCLSFQLYEIDDNPKRKEFLDELFSLMQKRGKCSQKISLFALCEQTQPILHLISPGNSIVLLFWLRAMRQRPLSGRAVFEIGRNHFQQSLKETNNFKCSIIQQKYLHIDAESFFEVCSFTKNRTLKWNYDGSKGFEMSLVLSH